MRGKDSRRTWYGWPTSSSAQRTGMSRASPLPRSGDCSKAVMVGLIGMLLVIHNAVVRHVVDCEGFLMVITPFGSIFLFMIGRRICPCLIIFGSEKPSSNASNPISRCRMACRTYEARHHALHPATSQTSVARDSSQGLV